MVIQTSSKSVRGIWALVAMICLLFITPQSHAQRGGTASASLSRQTVALGESLELQLRFAGQGQLKELAPIQAEGMDIELLPKRREYMRGGIHVLDLFLQVTPQREGKLTIPAFRFSINGEVVQTEALTFTVTPPGSGTTQSPRQTRRRADEAPLPSEAAFAEWVIPKRSAFVGEAIPVELRLYEHAKIRWEVSDFPSLEGDGYTIQKLSSRPTNQLVERDGKSYDLLIFKTAITPVKAGTITVGAAEFRPVFMLPRAGAINRNSRGMLSDIMDELMNDPMFNQAFLSPTKQSVKTEAVELEVKPLPLDGRPKNFSGAVGRFDLNVSANPLEVQAGDPVTVKAVVSGIGSFERMGQPTVASDPAWRAYPAKGQFFPRDEVAISGAKEFDIPMVANGGPGLVPLPKIEFSYFNPVTERYVTLHGDPLSVEVRGTLPAPTPSPAPGVAAPTPASTPAAESNNDIHPPLSTPGPVATFVPLWDQPSFWLLQGIPLCALLAWAGVSWMKARPAPAPAVLLRQAKESALARMKQATTEQQFADEAARALQMASALAAGGSEEIHTAEHRTAAEVSESKKVDAATAAGIQEIFALRDQGRYGGASGTAAIAPELRQRLTTVIQKFEESHHA